jgi:DNA-binding MarR family transcriptional regulator
VDPSVLIAVLDDLEPGPAERRRDPADRRRLIVEISARGTRLVADVHRAIGAIEAELFASTSVRSPRCTVCSPRQGLRRR